MLGRNGQALVRPPHSVFGWIFLGRTLPQLSAAMDPEGTAAETVS